MSDQQQIVNLTIDGKQVSVPKGTNLIEAALTVGIEIPFYCYHRHLSIAGNCRMCQVQLEGSPKLTIGCNTGATDGMVVKTQNTSDEVKDSQRATLEFLLINHPLDCTVCDQAGHCKLQDYYFEYNTKASRFIEEKTHKVKAEVLGPEVIYDGERCIVCTRCVRFCDEYTETSELSVLNRGDRTVIAVHEDAPLDNPFSGSVVDLCPVGALTHERWRFNSRIWYTSQTNSICSGCSTGCNTNVATRDGEVVQVKARLNSDVNEEWMCDEGRYGFERFQPKERLVTPLMRQGQYLEEGDWASTLDELKKVYNENPTTSLDTAFLISPFSTMEEIWTALNFADKVFGLPVSSPQIAVQLRKRKLTDLEAKLISPDYAPNARSAQFFGYLAPNSAGGGDWREIYESQYDRVLDQIRSGSISKLVVIGDRAILDEDLDEVLIKRILDMPLSIALSSRGVIGQSESKEESLGIHQLCRFIFPTQTVHEKDGVFVNGTLRFQKLSKILRAPAGVVSEWMGLKKIAEHLGKPILPANLQDERALFQHVVSNVSALNQLTLRKTSDLGISFAELEIPTVETSSADSNEGTTVA